MYAFIGVRRRELKNEASPKAIKNVHRQLKKE